LLTISPEDSIVGRLTALLSYLSATYPDAGWNAFLSNGSPNWSLIVIGGHSQGAGDAAYIAKAQLLAGTCTFDCPDDGNSIVGTALWLSETNSTPVSSQYGFTNRGDRIATFTGVTLDWSIIGYPGPLYDVDNNSPPYNNSHQLYTVSLQSGLLASHCCTIVDAYTPFSNNSPLFLPVWDYMCFR
jgi:hypothetical protein